MNPQHVRARNYKSIDDTGWIELDDLTCLIGKNEAGKTVVMEALERLNPVRDLAFEPYEDYPRHRWPEYEDRHEADPDPVVSVRFELGDDERAALRDRGGRPVDGLVTATRDYAGSLNWEFDLDESAYVDSLVDEFDIDAETADKLAGADSVTELQASLADREIDDDGETGLAALKAAAPSSAEAAVDEVGSETLRSELPEFRYVAEYTTLDAEIDIGAFLDRLEAGDATASDRVFESLLSIAGLDPERLRDDDDWRTTLTTLEAASQEVTEAATGYWSQADNLDIHLRGREEDGARILELRVENPDHGVTVEFDRRSQGFRWFFSTFCTLYDIRDRSEGLVLLLDEPGLHLHPKAKREFRGFLDREVAAGNTVVYSTHSPFMIDVDRAYQTKMVQKSSDDGSTVVSDPSVVDEYTRYPLRNVFELDVMQTLVSRSQLLLVEDGTTYELLSNVSELLEPTDAPVIDRRWTVLPIGRLENTDTVRAVFETADSEVAVVHDGTAVDEWTPPSGVTAVGIGDHARVDGRATVEDVLSEAFYLELVSRAYAAELSETDDVPDALDPEAIADVAPSEPIVERLARYFDDHGVGDGSFDRAVPASYLQRNRDAFADVVDMDTRKQFGSLSRTLNRTLGSIEDVDRSGSGGFLSSILGR